MATLLKIQSSLFNGHGQSSALTDQFTQGWLALHPEGTVISRNLATDPVPHLDQAHIQAFMTAPDQRTAAQQQMASYSDTLIQELERADTIVMGVPMYNFSVPSVLRAYFDHIARSGITFRYTANGAQGLLTGKKAYIITARGGYYGDGHSQTHYLREFLAFIGITDVEFIHAEGLTIGEQEKLAGLAQAREKISALLAAQGSYPSPGARQHI